MIYQIYKADTIFKVTAFFCAFVKPEAEAIFDITKTNIH